MLMPDQTNIDLYVPRSSRGIGLEIAKQLLASPTHIVLATCRNPSQATALVQLAESAPGRLHVLELDITDDASVRRSVDQVSSLVGDSGIDYLINNAAIMVRRSPQSPPASQWRVSRSVMHMHRPKGESAPSHPRWTSTSCPASSKSTSLGPRGCIRPTSPRSQRVGRRRW